MRKVMTLVGGLGLLLANGALAEERPFIEPPVDGSHEYMAESLGEESQNNFVEPSLTDNCSNIKIYGYFDGSYNYLQRSNQFVSGVDNREFDLKMNGFTFQQAGLTVAALPEQGWGSEINVLLGQDALKTAAYGYNPEIGSNIGFDILQVYLQYALGPLTLIGGKFTSLAGYEQVDASLDANFSGGLLATFSQPGTHFGLRAKYALAKQWDLFIGVNDGWDTIRDFHRDATAELGIAFASPDYFTLSAQFYSGEERAIERTNYGPIGRRNLFDIYATWQILEHLSVAANATYGNQNNTYLLTGKLGKSTWEGIAAYCTYQFNDMWRVTLRGEDFSDKEGYRTGVVQTLRELTITLGYAPWKNTEFRFETRRDISNVDPFVKRNGSLSDNQQSFAIQALYKFSNLT